MRRKHRAFARRLAVALLLCACVRESPAGDANESPGKWAPGDHALSIEVGGTDRRYVVHVPRGYDRGRDWPVVIMFHGGGGRARGAMRETGWAEKADREGFLAVFPEGTPRDPSRPGRFAGNPQTWNDGSGRTGLAAVARDVPDVEFVSTMLSDLKTRFRADMRRVYATGFSNGASMTFRLARELSPALAAVAPVAGADWMANERPARAVPLLYIAGTADPLNPVEGGEVRLGWRSLGRKPPTSDMIAEWVRLHGCPEEPRVVHDRDGARGAAYRGPDGTDAVVLYTLEGHGHHWPGGRSLLPQVLAGPNATRLNATDVIWDFFRTRRLPADAGASPREARPPARRTLRGAARGKLLIGCAAATRDLRDPKLAELIIEQFDCITPEYELMPEHVVDDRGRYTFERGDEVVRFAEEHGMPVFGHMLVWHFVSRRWLFEKPDGTPLSREKALANLEGHISTVVGRYRGRVRAWDVVNEAISDGDGEYLRETPALRAIGEDYVERAFEFAHAADPDADLYYNDYNIEQPAKLAKTLRLVRSLKAGGARVDAVGIQGHWLVDWPPTDMIEKGIDALAAAGVKVMITELDVDPLPREASGADMAVSEKGADPYREGLPPDVQERLARRYGEIVSAIVRHGSVTMLGFWGAHDGRSWLNDFPVKGRMNHPLLFDRRHRPKPAFDAVVKALERAR